MWGRLMPGSQNVTPFFFSNFINTPLGRRIPIRGKGQEKKTRKGKNPLEIHSLVSTCMLFRQTNQQSILQLPNRSLNIRPVMHYILQYFAQNRISLSASPSSSSSFTPSTSISSILHYTKLYLLIPNCIHTLPDYNARGTAQHPLVSGVNLVPQHSSTLY